MQITAEMSGLVNEIKVKPGDEVAPDDVLVVLESMKMLIEIKSPVKGTVRNILCSVEDFVQEGQVLIELA